MINTNELRRGNFIKSPIGVFKVSVIFDTGVKLDIGDGAIQEYSDSPIRPDLEDLEYVELTGQSLLGFGFKKVVENCFTLNMPKAYEPFEEGNHFEYDLNKNLIVFGYYGEMKITKVHELQNLYFALTKEELTINKDAEV